jgi:hypothetical protein
MEGANVFGVTNAPFVKIGAFGSPMTASLQVGDTGSSSHYVRFGKRSGLNSYMMNTFETYSNTALLEANQFFTLRSVVNMDLITETGMMTLTAETGGLQIKSYLDMIIDQSGSGAGMYISSTNNINMTSNVWTTFSDFYTLSGPTNRWLRSNPFYSYGCCTQYDVTDTMNVTMTIDNDGQTLAQDLTTQSQDVFTDLVMRTNANNTGRDLRIIAFNDARTISVMPNLNVPGYIINNGELELSGCGAQWTGAVFINDTLVVNGNTLIKGSLTQSGMSGMCPSDERFKHDIGPADGERCLNRLNRLEIKEFKYDADVAHQSGGKIKPNTTYYGVMAQDVESDDDFGYMVRKSPQTVNGVAVPDFRTISPELLYGEIVGAIQHLSALHLAMDAKQERMDAKQERMDRTIQKMRRTLRRLKKAHNERYAREHQNRVRG